MKSIEEYIKLSENKKNISNGGSAAYGFDDVVLVKYSGYKGESIGPRENEELIAKIINEKNERGVRTPKHLAIKRERKEDQEICWVLQEKARGINLDECFDFSNEETIKFLNDLANAPDTHYERCVKDLIELYNMGIELKEKNIFYDNSKENGGFTFIDFVSPHPNSVDFESFIERRKFFNSFQFLTGCLPGTKNGTKEEKDIVFKLYCIIGERFFHAMESVIPNFDKYRKSALRSYSDYELEYFQKVGIYDGDLKLDELEQKDYEKYIESRIDYCIEQLSRNTLYGPSIGYYGEGGHFGPWYANESQIWEYHPLSSKKRKDCEPFSEKEDAWKNFEEWVFALFKKRFFEVAEKSDNPYILKFKKELENYIKKERLKKIKNTLEKISIKKHKKM